MKISWITLLLILNSTALADVLCTSSCPSANVNVVYFHGLEPVNESFKAPLGLQKRNRAQLENLSKSLGICFALPMAPGVCSQGTQRCWPGSQATEVLNSTIQDAQQTCFAGKRPNGLIGFSNGGFFLSRLYESAQLTDLEWVVAIGSGAPKNSNPLENLAGLPPLKLVVSEGEVTAPNTRLYYKTLRSKGADVELIEVPGAEHALTPDFLMNFFKGHGTR